MTLTEYGAWFVVDADIRWDAARKAIRVIDADALWQRGDGGEIDWERIEFEYQDELPERPTATDLLPLAQVELHDHLEALQAHVTAAIEVVLPEEPISRFEPMFAYGHALDEAGGDWCDLGVTTEGTRRVYFTVSRLVRSAEPTIDDFSPFWSIWALGATDILAAAGATDWST